MLYRLQSISQWRCRGPRESSPTACEWRIWELSPSRSGSQNPAYHSLTCSFRMNLCFMQITSPWSRALGYFASQVQPRRHLQDYSPETFSSSRFCVSSTAEIWQPNWRDRTQRKAKWEPTGASEMDQWVERGVCEQTWQSKPCPILWIPQGDRIEPAAEKCPWPTHVHCGVCTPAHTPTHMHTGKRGREKEREFKIILE